MKDSLKFFQGVGRRKRATATARLTPNGTGKIIVNGKEHTAFFPAEVSQATLVRPMLVTAIEKADISIKVRGGGTTGQLGASVMAIARAILHMDENQKPTLRSNGLLTRDSREVERKKPNLKKARKAEQYSKR